MNGFGIGGFNRQTPRKLEVGRLPTAKVAGIDQDLINRVDLWLFDPKPSVTVGKRGAGAKL